MRTVELRHLRTFVAAAEELHFTRAGQRLNLAQQAVSTQVRQLEVELQTELFVRTTRSIQLTAAGETLLQHARTIIEAVDVATEATRAAKDDAARTILIGYSPLAGAHIIPDLVEAARRLAASIQIVWTTMWPNDAVRNVLSGRLDCAVAPAMSLPEELTCSVLGEETLGVIISRGHHLSRRSHVSAENLEDLTLAFVSEIVSPSLAPRLYELFPRHIESQRVYSFEVQSFNGFLDDAASRLEIAAGRAFQPAVESQYRDLPYDFVWRPLEPHTTIPMVLIYRRQEDESPFALDLLNSLRETVAP